MRAVQEDAAGQFGQIGAQLSREVERRGLRCGVESDGTAQRHSAGAGKYCLFADEPLRDLTADYTLAAWLLESEANFNSEALGSSMIARCRSFPDRRNRLLHLHGVRLNEPPATRATSGMLTKAGEIQGFQCKPAPMNDAPNAT